MSNNPYSSPQAPQQNPMPPGAPGQKTDLKELATYQRYLMFCILGTVLAYVAVIASQQLAPGLALVFGLVWMAVSLGSAVMCFLLAIKIHGTAIGIVLGILTLIPCVGLIALLVINQQCTGILTQNGISVGLMGADPDSIQ